MYFIYIYVYFTYILLLCIFYIYVNLKSSEVIHDTQSTQISQTQDGHNIYSILKTMCLNVPLWL